MVALKTSIDDNLLCRDVGCRIGRKGNGRPREIVRFSPSTKWYSAVYACDKKKTHFGRPSFRRIEGRGGSEPPYATAALRVIVCRTSTLEFGMLQIEWPSRIVAGAPVRSAELLRLGPCLEGGFALPHRMGGIERMFFGLGAFEQMELDKTRNAIEI